MASDPSQMVLGDGGRCAVLYTDGAGDVAGAMGQRASALKVTGRVVRGRDGVACAGVTMPAWQVSGSHRRGGSVNAMGQRTHAAVAVAVVGVAAALWALVIRNHRTVCASGLFFFFVAEPEGTQ